jgi:hypothetical protein
MFSLIDNNGDPSNLIYLIFFILLAILVFIILRKLILWYWRINEAVDALMNISNSQINISKSLEKISNSLEKHDNNAADNNDGLAKTLKQIEDENLLEEKK